MFNIRHTIEIGKACCKSGNRERRRVNRFSFHHRRRFSLSLLLNPLLCIRSVFSPRENRKKEKGYGEMALSEEIELKLPVPFIYEG